MQELESYKLQLQETQQQLIELKDKVEKIQSQYNEPIAIIGISMRLPGKIKNATDLWNRLINGIDCIEEIPANRWDKDALYDPNPNAPGKLYIKEGGFIEDIEYLDGSFFNISPIELESTDPQQRLLLEVTHEAFENAGIDVNSLIGSDTGVFIGIDNVDYEARQIRSKDYKLISGYCYTGTGPTGASGRISYTMGLRGPCMTIDTACSSALTCTHVAMQALRNKDCTIAVVGAASIISEPDQSLNFCRLGALSPEARCKSFDDAANGYIRSEGVCAMIIKRLSDAQKEGDNILAIIKGSAVNQDGKSKRLTAPSTVAQGMLHTAALKNAQLNHNDIDYIEAHGTGTKVGDPAEVRGLMFAYEKYRNKENPLIIGAIKSNIGHMECNAGMASMFKVIVGLQHNIIPKSIHFHTPNTLIDWENIPLIVAKDNIPWKRKSDQPRYAGISGFGATGSNAHVIIGDAPENPLPSHKLSLRKDVFILPLSAKSEQALLDLAKSYSIFIQENTIPLEDICAMAALRRAHFDLRQVFVATSKEAMIEQLTDFAQSNIYESKKKFDLKEKIKTVFVFPGQGAQWFSMGKALMENEPVYKSAIEECSNVFSKYTNWNLIEEINKPELESRLSEIDIVQPVLVAVEIALASLWMSKGIFPDAVIGHSMGEVAAAYVAGNITLDDAARIIITRSKLMKNLSGKGAMGATDLREEEAIELLKGYEDKLAIAVLNSKNSLVLSGEPDALNEIFSKLESKERFNKKIKVDVASHSPQMDSIVDELAHQLSDIQPQNSTIQFYSTALDTIVEGAQLNTHYWTKNLRNTVRFGNAVQAVLTEAQVAFIEMSPHPLLQHALNENIQAANSNSVAIASYTRDKNELIEFHHNIGELYASGYNFDWKSIYPNIGTFVQLPNYAWQKERYWFDQEPDFMPLIKGVKKDIHANLYGFEWQTIQPKISVSTKNILIIKDIYGYFENITQALKEKGCSVRIIDETENIPSDKTDLIIHLSSLNTNQDFSLDIEHGILSLQRLIQHLNVAQQHPKICVITNGSFVLQQDKNTNLNASMLTGILRTLENEHEEINFLQIDISNEIQAQELNQISHLVFAENTYKEIAIRENNIYASVIQQQSILNKPKKIHADKTYIVVGGTSGLGLTTVKWLVENKAKKIAVISRSGAKGEAAKLLEQYKLDGIQITDIRADISNIETVENTFSAIQNIAGVFYAAGILDDGAFENLTKEQFENVIRTKAVGAWNVHTAVQSLPLDFFVLYSSAAGIVGSAGQSNYNAANTFMDALAHFRRANNLTAISVNFGTIAEIGLAARQENRADRLAEQGVTAIQPNDLFHYFDAVFLSDATQIMAMEIDFNKWAQFNHAILNNYFYSKVIQQKTIIENKEEKSETKFASVDEYKKHIRDRIKLHISTATKLSIAKIKEDETFKSLGVDSLHALQLKNKLQDDFKTTLSVAAVWQYPTIQKLSDFIAKELNIEQQFSTITEEKEMEIETTKKEDIETSVKNLSLDDLMKELNSKID